MGLLYDDDNVSTTAATLAGFSVHDAFGNDMSAKLAKTGSFEWRGGEGSVTDRESGLVHMQARHYDPSIGRFLQADTLALASLTTQGTNRFLYTENDPVNGTDPTGRVAPILLAIGFVLAIAFALSFAVGYLATAPPSGWAAGITSGVVGGIGSWGLGLFGDSLIAEPILGIGVSSIGLFLAAILGGGILGGLVGWGQNCALDATDLLFDLWYPHLINSKPLF